MVAPASSPDAAAADEGEPAPGFWSRRWPDLAGLAWVVVAALAMFVPALHHGHSLGPYDVLANGGLTRQTGVTVHNTGVGDQIAEMIPWNSLAWTQVHHGHLPLWNPDSGLGVPLLANSQSAPFSVPAVLGYLVPLRYSYTLGVVVTALIAGTGMYTFLRTLGYGPLAGAMAGTVFELSGALVGWMGTPLASVFSWIGWVGAFGVLLVRGRHRWRDAVLLAVCLAAALYAGNAEAMVLLTGTMVVFFLILVIGNALRGHSPLGAGRSLLHLLGAGALGLALAAPVVLPGYELLRGSVRSTATYNAALPLHDLAYLVAQGYDGLPLAGSQTFGTLPYIETASFVGVIALVAVAVAVATRWRRIEVVALLGATAAALAVVFVSPVVSLLRDLPVVGPVLWQRGLLALAFALAALAGIGLEALVTPARSRLAIRVGIGAAAVLLVGMVGLVLGHSSALTSAEQAIRRHSLTWPLVEAAAALLLLMVAGAVTSPSRRWTASSLLPSRQPRVAPVRAGASSAAGLLGGTGPAPSRPAPASSAAPRAADTKRRRGPLPGGLLWLALSLLAVQTVALVGAEAPLWSSSPNGAVTTPAVTELRQQVGNGVVGFGSAGCFLTFPDLGIVPDANALYGVHELDVYDATTPQAYFTTWSRATGQAAGVAFFYEYCPEITTTAEAQLYGVSYVLEPAGQGGPSGTALVGAVGGERLYRVPGAAAATLVPLGPSGAVPAVTAPGRPVAVTTPNPSTWQVDTSSSAPTVLRLRLSDVPGWHATVDGHPLALSKFAGVMLQARLPAGDHRIVLSYWPTAFSLGLWIALLAVLAIAGVTATLWYRREDSDRRSSDRGGAALHGFPTMLTPSAPASARKPPVPVPELSSG